MVVTNVGRTTAWPGELADGGAPRKAGIVKPDSFPGAGHDARAGRFLAEARPRRWVATRDFDVVTDLVAVGSVLGGVRTPNGTLDDLYLPLRAGTRPTTALA